MHVLKTEAEADKLTLTQELEAIKTADQERLEQMSDLRQRLAAAQTENKQLLAQLEDKAARLQVDSCVDSFVDCDDECVANVLLMCC